MKGILFDLDGTMVDNMMIHHLAWQKKLAELGVEMSIDEVRENIHGINEEILERLFGDRFSPEQRRQISWEKEAAYREIFKPDLQLLPGLRQFLDAVKGVGIPMAVGTAAPPENADFVIDTLNLRNYFTGVLHAKDVTRGKPDPEIYLKAAATMGLSPVECLIFEDSVSGAEAAKRAGSKAVIITTTHTRDEFDGFDHIISFIRDFEGIGPDILNDT